MTSQAPPVNRVLVATDRSETAGRAVAWAAEMATRYEAELWLLQVLLPVDMAEGATSADRARLPFAQQELAREAEELAGTRGRALVVLDDDPAAAIVETADAESVDVIVVGNAGMTGRKEFLLGNVPNRVSHNARCSVVIVNSTAPEPQAPGRFRGRR
jgi:nucleotide-binding universal stress UspA family protein